MKEYVALFKIGRLEHLQALRDEGHLYCNPLRYFSKLEDNIRRGDELEGITAIKNLDGCTLRMKDVGAPDSTYSKPININTGKLMHSADNAKGNIFCLYSIGIDRHELRNDYNINEEAKTLGDHFLIIKNYHEFLKRVRVKLEELGMTGVVGFITYKDFTGYSGDKTHFEKDLAFAHQQEFRIFINNQSEEILNIKIGSIADISEIGCCINLDAITFYDSNEIRTSK
jgi:hypothetical protein